MRWIPWKFFLRRTARAHGFIDPVQFLARLRRFAQPSEVHEPIELIRAGIIFHARGILNTKTIQNNLDWIWPYWVEKQFDPNDPSFIPRGFTLSHINLTHRNWTAIGLPDLPVYPIVDPRGLVTPQYDGWSLDFWMIAESGEHLLPAKLSSVHQRIGEPSELHVETFCQENGKKLCTSAWVEYRKGRPCLVVRATAEAEESGKLAVALRPYNPEGIQFIETVSFDPDQRQWCVNDETSVNFSESPERVLFSTYADGDVYHDIGAAKAEANVSCDVGMATAAAFFPMAADMAREIDISIPLEEELHREKGSSDSSGRSWDSLLGKTAQLTVPDSSIRYLYKAAVRTLILLSAGELVPGPFTYRRFWFRDACFMINALLSIGLTDRCRRLLDTFPARQKRSGYFQSQEGEWDSNGQVLWIMNRFQELTGQAFESHWMKPVLKGAGWIMRKRKSKNVDTRYAGLLPAGFSAEHLGPNDYYYWDDFWGVAGLTAAARLAGKFHSTERMIELLAEARDFRTVIDRSIAAVARRRKGGGIPASPNRRMDSGAVGSLVADYPLKLTEPGDSRIMTTIQFLMERCFQSGAFFQDMIHSGINAYLTLCIAQTLLRAGDSRYRGLITKVADLASPTGQWPEAIHPSTGGGCMGDGQHGWAAAEWVMMIRNMFIREEGDTLIIGSGIFSDWLETDAPIDFGPTPTPYGTIRVKMEREKNHLNIEFEPALKSKPPRVQIAVPGFERRLIDDFTETYRVEEL